MTANPKRDLRDDLLHAIDFNYAAGLGYGTPEELLAAYDASRTPADRAALRDRIADVLAAADGWSWVEDFDKTKSPAYQGYQSRADAVLAVLPPADQATVAALRDRIAEALREWVLDSGHGAEEGAAADAVLAVLPSTADRAAAVAATIRACAEHIRERYSDTWTADAARSLELNAARIDRGEPTALLRRMADETPAEAEGDSLPAWLYRQFAVIHGAPDWEQLDDAARPYWEHQARAVRRAVARGGIEQPAAEMHSCGNCEGVDSNTCFNSPNRPKLPPMDPVHILGIKADNEPATETYPPAAAGLPAGTLEAAEIGANRLDAWARSPQGRNFLAHALVQLARTGWLRAEPGEPFEPMREDAPSPEPAAGARQDEAPTPAPPCTHCPHPKGDHDGRADHRAKYPPLVAGEPWCHACNKPCDYAADGARQGGGLS